MKTTTPIIIAIAGIVMGVSTAIALSIAQAQTPVSVSATVERTANTPCF